MFGSLFQRRQKIPDFSDDAEILFRNMAEEFSLRIEKREGDPVELSMDLPSQEGLKYDIWLCLQNDDEIWFCVGDLFTCSMFPYSEVKKKFSNYLRGALSGAYRIVTYTWTRSTRPSISELQRPTTDGWETIYTYSNTLGLAYLFKRWLNADILYLTR